MGTETTFQPVALLAALVSVPADAWGQPQPAHEPTNPGYRLASLVNSGYAKPVAAGFGFVLDEFAPIWSAWIAEVPAYGIIGLHVDEGPYRERWHVPIVATATFNGVRVEAGVPFRVRHWEPHRVDNPVAKPRVHLVIDRDVMVDVPTVPFQRME